MSGHARADIPTGLAQPHPSSVIGPPLSLRLREETAELHLEVERRLNLPAAIRSLDRYREYLERFYGLYEPLETLLASFTEWNDAGIALPEYIHSARLACDLEALGAAPSAPLCAPLTALPALLRFPQALGALYVIEGSSLGSLFILRQLTEVLGEQIADADSFLRGRGAATIPHWQRFRALLDEYGAQYPEQASSVIEGARSTFQAVGAWVGGA